MNDRCLMKLTLNLLYDFSSSTFSFNTALTTRGSMFESSSIFSTVGIRETGFNFGKGVSSSGSSSKGFGKGVSSCDASSIALGRRIVF